ncbi:hypothetical protein WJ96_07205 [Burkholderia ubonensis]|uniref:Uncharacterized protein n=1 Tax=Burkholderia ubonensis TaxID=101571 RepID=A0AAW3MYM5_9BURK|nr:hypothetical protein [Burkholderia ubonensis]KVP75488.1 hypothetical protein WJ93_09000 [Burkholderia ubonensis]KVP96951.1 hypothetical protein WJ97_14110 [Burkholderia ubonensis]KVP98301.1 hypothetical protein WJ96_07205 [Burkholderia ubonensis]KVZ92999.1 hypothetical protein WL25_18865 [Burkholderia ubonensis]
MKLERGFWKFAVGVLVGIVGSIGVHTAIHHGDIKIRPTPLGAPDIAEQAQLEAKARFVRQMHDGQEYAHTLARNAAKSGEVADADVRYLGPDSWGCRVWVRDAKGGTSADGQAETIERACTNAVLYLNKRNDL